MMRYSPIDPQLFQQNRTDFANQMQDNSIAIFNSNDIMPTNADGIMGFKQNSDLFYLTGIDQEETLLMLIKSNKELESILFIKETSPLIKIWEGEKLVPAQATEISGIKNVKWIKELDDQLKKQLSKFNTVYLNKNDHARSSSIVQTRDDRFGISLRSQYPDTAFLKSSTILHRLRQVKKSIEIEQIKKAVNITENTYKEILPLIKPGKFEFEIEAEITYRFIKNRAGGHAYQPIIASGENACVLHYTENNRKIKDGDLILMDFGAVYANYNADLTRTVPANGKYSPRQKAVYNAVLRILKFASTQLTDGNYFKEYNASVVELLEKELVDLNLITTEQIKNQQKDNPLYKKYFMHGLSHSLGIDVHDVDDRSIPFTSGMVFTCEPGIYIPEEGIGVRIENDLVIDGDKPINLMKNTPIECEEIEEWMNRK